MNHVSLDALAREQLKRAAVSGNGRSAETVVGGHEKVLRQTVIAMTEGAELAEHESPGEATLTVIVGRVELVGQDASWQGRAGDLLVIPDQRHSLRALEDSAILLTVAKR
ncbi:MAG: cupin domain-containing protein [Geodermatophilaceae bacterium]|nr:cupin domain-containing protein [Geodermatophilaceae bacterium]